MRGLGALALLAAPLLAVSCKRGAETADAGAAAPLEPIVDARLGIEVQLPASWDRKTGPSANLPAGWVFDARRRADADQKWLVAPRLALSSEPLESWLELDTLVDKNLAAIRAIEDGGGARIDRTTKQRRMVDGVELAELRVDYRVFEPGGGAQKAVVQRVWLGHRFAADQAPWVFNLTATYLASDEEVLGKELEDVLRSLHFREGAAAP